MLFSFVRPFDGRTTNLAVRAGASSGVARAAGVAAGAGARA